MNRGYDVRTKLLFLLLANYYALVTPGIGVIWVLILLFSLDFIWRHEYVRLASYLIFFGLATACLSLNINEASHPYLGFFLLGGLTIMPCFMVGLSILRTPVHEFIQTLRKWRVPESILLVLAVAMRFLPTVTESYLNIRAALKLRGEFVSWYQYLLHPLAYFEKILVPLLLNATRLGQDLTIAALTKAVGSHHKTSYRNYVFTGKDYLGWFGLGGLVLFTLGGFL